MGQLAGAQDQLPSSLFVSGVNDRDEHPTFSGGFGDIYRASYQGKMVALKRIKTFTMDTASYRTRMAFCREAIVWRGLRHRFILPLVGIDRQMFPSSFCMVSPWMKNGTVLKYLRDRGHGDVDRLVGPSPSLGDTCSYSCQLLETAQGLEYLHAQNIVHGDLRGTNILISDDNSACLSDFGLATTVSDAQSTTAMAASSTNHAGSVRWWPPELISPTGFGCERFVRTPASDVYAYGCVCLELYSGRPPFSEVNDAAAMLRVIQGERPQRPAGMSEELWRLVNAAWATDSRIRPTIQYIVSVFPGSSNANYGYTAPESGSGATPQDGLAAGLGHLSTGSTPALSTASEGNPLNTWQAHTAYPSGTSSHSEAPAIPPTISGAGNPLNAGKARTPYPSLTSTYHEAPAILPTIPGPMHGGPMLFQPSAVPIIPMPVHEGFMSMTQSQH
ncbi:kinase-like domain-containing protein [Mycena epipterygia]|nr:kinase-like domain-containing protein [Mycena epipterygia]